MSCDWFATDIQLHNLPKPNAAECKEAVVGIVSQFPEKECKSNYCNHVCMDDLGKGMSFEGACTFMG